MTSDFRSSFRPGALDPRPGVQASNVERGRLLNRMGLLRSAEGQVAASEHLRAVAASADSHEPEAPLSDVAVEFRASVAGGADPMNAYGMEHDEDCCTGNGCECFERRRLARLRSYQQGGERT